MRTRVATLMCVYRGDQPGALEAALASVIEQRLDRSIESRLYLGIDGPTSPELERVIDAFERRIHRIYRAPVNQGLARTLNDLIARLEDESLVFRMDADDVSLPGRYQAQIDYLRTHEDIDILGTAITEVDQASGKERFIAFSSGPDEARANAHARVPVAHPTVCMRRHVLSATGGYPANGTNEDVALWFECFERGFRFDNLNSSYLRFNISPAFWRRRSTAKAWGEFLCYVRGIHRLDGLLTWKYLYPTARLLMRLAPTSVSRWLYGSALRSRREPSADTSAVE